MLRLHSRLQPHLLRYRQLMSDDQDYTNRVCNASRFTALKATVLSTALLNLVCRMCTVCSCTVSIIRQKYGLVLQSITS